MENRQVKVWAQWLCLISGFVNILVMFIIMNTFGIDIFVVILLLGMSYTTMLLFAPVITTPNSILKY